MSVLNSIIASLRSKPATRRDPKVSDPTLRNMSLRTDRANRPDAIPAWALTLRSPFTEGEASRSFLGGWPVAPSGTPWPQDDRGKPLLFIGQVDLADLLPEPETGARPPHLPSTGAMLMFFGRSARCLIIDADKMQRAQPMDPPKDLPDLRDAGFWIDGKSFPRWDVDVEVFLDRRTRGQSDYDAPKPVGGKPEDGLHTWADAALEADRSLRNLRMEHEHRTQNLTHRRNNPPAGNASEWQRNKFAKSVEGMTYFVENGPVIIDEAAVWASHCHAQTPDAAVDRAAIRERFAQRRAHAERMGSFPEKFALEGSFNAVWNGILERDKAVRRDETGQHDFNKVPPCHRAAVGGLVAAQRPCVLFGHGWVREDLNYDLRGLDPVFTVMASPFLATQSEHESGFSGWYPRTGPIAETDGDICQHTNV